MKYEVTKELAENEAERANTLCEDEVPALKYWPDYEMNETHHRMTYMCIYSNVPGIFFVFYV